MVAARSRRIDISGRCRVALVRQVTTCNLHRPPRLWRRAVHGDRRMGQPHLGVAFVSRHGSQACRCAWSRVHGAGGNDGDNRLRAAFYWPNGALEAGIRRPTAMSIRTARSARRSAWGAGSPDDSVSRDGDSTHVRRGSAPPAARARVAGVPAERAHVPDRRMPARRRKGRRRAALVRRPGDEAAHTLIVSPALASLRAPGARSQWCPTSSRTPAKLTARSFVRVRLKSDTRPSQVVSDRSPGTRKTHCAQFVGVSDSKSDTRRPPRAGTRRWCPTPSRTPCRRYAAE